MTLAENQVLDLWEAGYTGVEIVAELGYGSKQMVSLIVKKARETLDPRATPHYNNSYADTALAASGWSDKQLLLMDAKFKARMLRAIKAGKEKAIIGVYKSNIPSTYVPHRFQPMPIHSMAGSSASMCAEAGGGGTGRHMAPRAGSR